MTGPITFWISEKAGAEVSIVGAATTDIGSVESARIGITGSATVSSFGTVPNRLRFIRWAAAATLVQSSSLLVSGFIGSGSLIVAADDGGIALSDNDGNWIYYPLTPTGLASAVAAAQGYAADAELSAASAAVSAASAAVSANVFANTTLGLAATSGTGSTNRYFTVPQSAGSGYLNLYRNDAGVATLINVYPDKTQIDANQTAISSALHDSMLWIPAPGLYPTPKYIKARMIGANDWLIKHLVNNGDYSDYAITRMTNGGSQNRVGTKGPNVNTPLPYAWSLSGTWARIGGIWVEGYDGLKDGYSVHEAVWGFGKTTSLLSTFDFATFRHGNLGYKGDGFINLSMDGGSNQNLSSPLTYLEGESLVFSQEFDTILPEDGVTVMGRMTASHTFNTSGVTDATQYDTAFANQGTFTAYAGQTPVTGFNQCKFAGGSTFAIGNRMLVNAQISGTVMTVIDVIAGGNNLTSGKLITAPTVTPGTETIPGGSGSGGAGTYNISVSQTVARRVMVISEGAATAQVNALTTGVLHPTTVGFNHTVRPTIILEHILPKGWPADPLQWSEVRNPTSPFTLRNPANDKVNFQGISEVTVPFSTPAQVNTGNQRRWRVGTLA